MKILRNSIIIDPSMMRFLNNNELTSLIKSILGILRDPAYRIYISISPFNANVLVIDRVYRMSIAQGAFIVTSIDEHIGEDLIDSICNTRSASMSQCWYLREDVWSDVRALRTEVDVDERYPCMVDYIRSLEDLGFSIREHARLKIICLRDYGENVYIEDTGDRSYMVIPDLDADLYKKYVVSSRGGFRHPIAAILSGREVLCGNAGEVNIPDVGVAIVMGTGGEPLLYGVEDLVYIFPCKPNPWDLLFRASALYMASTPIARAGVTAESLAL
jgi:hypothetical protein